MTDRPELARSATELLAEHRVEPRAASPTARAAAIAAGRRAMVSMKRSRRRRLVAALAAAATVVLAIGIAATRRTPPVARAPHPTPSAVVQIAKTVGSVQLSSASGTLAAGDRVIVGADGSAALNVSTGTHVTVDGGGDLSVISTGAEQAFSLRAGSARFDVAKVAAGERFVVRTTDSVIEVRGTAFDVTVVSVDPACSVATTTRLRVREGVVVVRAQGVETTVSAGGMWPAGCEASPAPEPTTSVTSTATATASAPRPKTAPSGTALTEQNALFSDAAAAKKRGDRATALQLYDRLLSKYPASSLAESATVERMRLLSGPARSAAARAYLAKYPKGFARAEAMKIAVGAE